MKKIIMVLAAGIFITACQKSQQCNVPPQPQQNTAHSASHKSGNGVQGSMSAYYDSVLFTINPKQLPDDVAANLLAHNKSLNTIYEMETGDEVDLFVPVLDAIQKDGFNPLWQEVEITFTPGHTPRQFYSDDQVLTAEANGEITLNHTNEVYRCSVIGHK